MLHDLSKKAVTERGAAPKQSDRLALWPACAFYVTSEGIAVSMWWALSGLGT